MASSREENVYMAKLGEQAERIEEMVEFMEKVSITDTEELTVEERNLLSVAYKNVVGARCASRRIISSIKQNEESPGNEDQLSVIEDYRSKIEKELSDLCDKVSNPTIKGDYQRYLAELKTGVERKESVESTLTAYKSPLKEVVSEPESDFDIGEWHDHSKCIEEQEAMPKPVLPNMEHPDTFVVPKEEFDIYIREWGFLHDQKLIDAPEELVKQLLRELRDPNKMEVVPEEEIDIDISEMMFGHDLNKCSEAQQAMPKPGLWDMDDWDTDGPTSPDWSRFSSPSKSRDSTPEPPLWEKAPFNAKAEKRKREYEKNLASDNKKLAAGGNDEDDDSDKSKSEANDEEDSEEDEDDD